MNPLARALIALGLMVATGVAGANGADSVGAEPAPPPSSCRVAPQTGWPAVTAASVGDLSPYQDYRDGLGIDPTLTGAGVRVADVEYEWAASHVDLAGKGLLAADPNSLDSSYRARDHGTAVLGILGAANDGHGITGLAADATLLPISPLSGLPSAYHPAETIRQAAVGLRPGDVLLIELQALVQEPGRADRLGPIEYYDDVRREIRRAVDRGIVVVEPAGNGDLDVASLGPAWLSGPTAPNHSGALMVGAGGSGFGESAPGDRERVPGSDYGARVDVQGFGGAVVSTGYGDLSDAQAGADRTYTRCFDGTSSASATVAGAVAVLQSAAIARDGVPLAPATVRALLVQTGLPQIAPESGPGAQETNIGPRPSIAAALATGTPPQPPTLPDPEPPAITPPTGAASTALPAPFVVSSVVAAPIHPVHAPAVRGISAGFSRLTHTIVIRLNGAAPSIRARIDGRHVRLDRGRVVLRGASPGRLVLRVRAPRSTGVIYRDVRFRIVVPRHGPVRVTRLS